MYITDFEITQAAVELVGGLVCAMLAVVVVINSPRVSSTRYMERLLLITSALLIFDALCFVFRGNTGLISILVNQGSNCAVFILDLFLSFCSIQFIYSILRERGAVPSNSYRCIVLVCTIIGGMIVLSNLPTGWMYFFDEENQYHRNGGWYVYAAFNIVSLTASCTLLLHYRKYLSSLRLISLLFFELCPIIAVVVQWLFYGLAITNMAICVSVVLLLLTYLVTWSHSDEAIGASQLRHSYDTIVLFIIMAVSISGSIVTCILSVRRVADDISVSNSRMIAYVVSDQIEETLATPITVAQTLSRDRSLQTYMRQSADVSPEELQSEMADYLTSIRTGFGYQTVFAICDRTNGYYTDKGLLRLLAPQQSRADQWYASTVNSGRDYLLNVGASEVNGWAPNVYVNAVVRDSDGSVLGVCGVAIQVDELQALLSEFESQYHIKVALLGQEGEYEIRSSGTTFGQFVLPKAHEDTTEGDFIQERLSGVTRLTQKMKRLGWYLTVEDLEPEKVSVLQTIIPNILILLVGLFTLLAAFYIILRRERRIESELLERHKNALHDELTGLKNRRALREDHTLLEEKRASGTLAVVQMDLNGLKSINDGLGHQAGDELITSAATCMTQAMRGFGELYRTGGDEFIAILSCDAATLGRILSDLDIRCTEWHGTQIDGISLSKGISLSSENPGADLDELIALADQKMYEEKRRYHLQHGKS